MTIVYWTNSLSPHQLPLAREIAKRIGEGNYRYLYRDEPTTERKALGWNFDAKPEWCRRGTQDDPALMDADLVYTGGLRPLNLVARRIAAGKKTYYVTERWFKPLRILGLNMPGRWRMLSPGYSRMARRMVAMLNNPLCKVLAIGPWAKKDMVELGVREEQIWDWGYFVDSGVCSCLESRSLTGRSGVSPLQDGGSLDFVVKRRDAASPSQIGTLTTTHSPNPPLPHSPTPSLPHSPTLKLLWVGRLLKLKHVDTIIRAVSSLPPPITPSLPQSSTPSLPHPQLSLDIYGTGPEESSLRKLAAKSGDVIKFHPPVPIDEVRKLMREHDVYVMASDENEGWGAVVSEALQEGMRVLGTFESGASAAMLPKERLFHSGDWRGLVDLLVKESRGALPACSIGEWTAAKAAERLLGLL